MSIKQTFLTQEGLENLENELDELKSVRRREVAEKIKIALSFGDLSENSEYDEAKNEQGMLEARISEIEKTLANVKILDSDELSTEHINIGNKIIIKELQKGGKINLHIVGSKEVDMKKGKISDESPIGAACIGKQVGDIIEVHAPSGINKYEILEITK